VLGLPVNVHYSLGLRDPAGVEIVVHADLDQGLR
jgi:hypothetical protein